MSQAQPPKGSITRAPKDSEIDQIYMKVIASIGLVALGAWLLWNSSAPAVTYVMLKQDHVETIGQDILLWKKGIRRISGYQFKDQNGKLWIRITSPVYGSSYANPGDLKVDKVFPGDVTVLVHPKYPKFFAQRRELPDMLFNLKLSIGSILMFLFAGWWVFSSVRKYKRLKAIAAYY